MRTKHDDDLFVYLEKATDLGTRQLMMLKGVPKRYICLPLVAGVVTPPLVLYILQSIYGPHRYVSPISSLHPFEIILAMIPFAALVALMLAISKVTLVRRELIFWGGLIPAWGFTAYAHWSVWYPIYMGGRMSSTFAIVFLFIPLHALFYSAIGVLVGWGVSFLPPFQERGD